MMTRLPQLKPLCSFRSPGSHLCGLAWDGTHLWYSDGDTRLLYQLDVQTGSILVTLPCPEVRTGLSFDGGHLWQIAGHPKCIRVIDPDDGEVRDEIALGANAEQICGLLVQNESYWTGPESNAYIEQYSRATRRLTWQYGPVSSADGLAIIGSLLWYTSYKDSALIAMDLQSGTEVRRYHLTGNPTDMCWGGQMFWYNDYAHKQICAVRPDDL